MKRWVTFLMLCMFAVFGWIMASAENEQRLDTVFSMYEEYRQSFPDIQDVSVEKYLEWQKTKNILLVDARSEKERRVSAVPQALSRSEAEKFLRKSENTVVVTYCTIGYRSARYARKLRDQGIEAYNLKGGILAWTHAGHTVVDPKGVVTRRVHVYGKTWDLLPEGYESVYP